MIPGIELEDIVSFAQIPATKLEGITPLQVVGGIMRSVRRHLSSLGLGGDGFGDGLGDRILDVQRGHVLNRSRNGLECRARSGLATWR